MAQEHGDIADLTGSTGHTGGAARGDGAGLIDSTEAHSARVYDYILGGRDNYEVDRAVADAMCAQWPALPVHMRANRTFMHRAAAHLARERGVRQFLDIGTGLPTRPNLHEVVQDAAPASRVVYVDNDPVALLHGQALLSGTAEGRTGFIDADMREPEAILGSEGFRRTLDLNEPVGLMMIGILHFILPSDDDHGLVRRLLEPLPPGSFLAATIGTGDFAPDEVGRVAREYGRQGMPMQLRSHAEASEFFTGLELEEPGVVQVHRWRPRPGDEPADDKDIAMYGGVARKP